MAILNDFIQKASGKPEYDGAVKRAKDRVQDAGDIITFLETPDDTSSSTPPPPASGAKDAPPAPAAGAGGTTAPAQPATPAK